MPEKAKANIEMGHLFPTLEVGPFAEFNARNLATVTQTSTAFQKGMAAYWSHIGSFMGKRFKADAEVATTLSTCRTGEEAARTHHQFISNMISDYFNEMHALLSIGAEAAKGMAEPIENRTEEAVQKMESRTAAE